MSEIKSNDVVRREDCGVTLISFSTVSQPPQPAVTAVYAALRGDGAWIPIRSGWTVTEKPGATALTVSSISPTKKKWPRKWHEVYAQGTAVGNEEQQVFIALARHPKAWRSVEGMAKGTGLTERRIEEILSKYLKLGIVFQRDDNPSLWGYWERHKDLVPVHATTIKDADHKDRVAKAK